MDSTTVLNIKAQPTSR